MKTRSLIWGEGHVHQADLSMCFVSCIVFVEVMTPLLRQRWLVILSQCWNVEMVKSFAVTHYLCWAYTASYHVNPPKEKLIHKDSKLFFEPPFSKQWYYSKRVLYAAWNVHNKYTCYVKYICIYCKWMDWYSIFGDATVWKKWMPTLEALY